MFAPRAGRRTWCLLHGAVVCLLAGGSLWFADIADASEPPGPGLTTCFWSDVIDPPGGNNIVLPDANATYWYTRFALPAGGKVVLRGDFPHARSFFLWNYHLDTPFDGVHDAQVAPDPGSANPFVDGGDRSSEHRAYTLTVLGQSPPPPAQRAPNTIYAGTQQIQLTYRVYRPDGDRDRMGDAALPEARYVTSAGAELSGQAACDALHNDGAQTPNALPLTAPDYLAHLALSPDPTHPATNPSRWYAFFNALRLGEPFYQGTFAQWMIGLLPTTKTLLAVAPDADSGIAYSYVDRSLGPDRRGHNVLVLRGKLPRTPATFTGDSQLQGGTQMRYWSICQYDSFVLGRVGACLFDEQVPVDQGGWYRIVVSLPEDRPANATQECGAAWLDFGRMGDGLFKPRAGLLLLRNQLPDPAFDQTIAAVNRPGTERQVMGDYLPTGSYQSRAQFEAHGCA